MSERKLNPLKLWPLLACAVLVAWELYEANAQGRSPDPVWLGIVGAAALFVIIVRVFMKV
jgi:hypothetical protein